MDRLLSERSIFEDVKTDDTILLGRRNRFVPLGAPVRLRSRSEARILMAKD